MKSRIDVLRKLYAESTRNDLFEVIERQEDLFLRSADRELDNFVKPVFERLLLRRSLSDLQESDAWPYAGSLSDAGFLSHFFWAKYETDYGLYWDTAFEGVIREECIRCLGHPENWDDFQFDLFMEACGVEEVTVSVPTSVAAWAARSLYLKVYDILLDGDMDTIRGWGVDVGGQDDDDDDE
ncbi:MULTISPECIES: hypothetical protein [unclassified Yoonia]|uniref:hypothetical protein n=1 Tax=unclassified Yoonia TaxID=2629118 RepID=UPI002AFE27B5|nr:MULTISPECIES: hypothetical protein [unclassified Yoonia]